MWNDIETTNDYLHFSVVSGTVAELIDESGNNPISIGVSGNWGTGKSSMVKMIGKELEKSNKAEKTTYIFLEFNAWLYQGYDDAKTALLQSVAKKLSEELKKRHIPESDETLWKRFQKFTKRINWLQVSKIGLPLLVGLIPGAAPTGVAAALISSIVNSIKTPDDKGKNAEAVETNLKEFLSNFDDILKDDETKSTTQQIEELRKDFEDILEKLNIRLVVLVDDLDRCLPETAISTLEAMRLLLFVKRTAFIIAADEQMIRNGVRAHFGNVDLSDDLITSYFDKLIQVPITVPRLGIPEVKVYTFLLFLDLEARKGNVSIDSQQKVQKNLEEALSKAWQKNVSLVEAKSLLTDSEQDAMAEYISISEQIAGVLVSSNRIKGNPRLIKRFLNALEIRKKVARLNGITVDSGILIKMLLFERCASGSAFEYLAEIVSKSKDGKPEELKKVEDELKDGKEFIPPDSRWKDDFIKEWILLEPKLSEYDLRPLLYLSRDKSITFAAYDKLSADGEDIFKALQNIESVQIYKEMVTKIQTLRQEEAEILMHRVFRFGHSDQWSNPSLGKALHIIKAYPNLANDFVTELSALPASARKAPMANVLKEYDWANELLQQWKEDPDTPQPTKNVIKTRK
mgnify:FL=1